MKKLYILLCILFLFGQNKAQHTLTAAFNPAIGDIESYIALDTTAGVFLGSSGISQTWNYTSISTGTNTPYSYTYVPISSVINNSLYPTGTIAGRYGVGGYDKVYNNTSSQIEFLGFAQPTASNCQVYSDPAIFYSLPFSYGSSSSDTYTYTSWSGTYTGTIITTGDGTGTLQLPSGNYSNILKITLWFYDGGFTSVEDRFYSTLSKFPLLTISSGTIGASVYKSGQINILVAASVKETEYNSAFNVFPNPVSNGELFISNANSFTGRMTIEIINVLGQSVNTFSLENQSGTESKKINVSDLTKGIYYLRISSKEVTKTQKIIIE